MTDPIDALISLQKAVNDSTVHMTEGKFYPNVKCLIDYPDGETRYTYAKIIDNEVQAIAILGLIPMASDVPYFQIGFGVKKSKRGQGMGIRLMKQALKELVNDISTSSMKEFYLQAIVNVENEASNNISRKYISNSPTSIFDTLSGEPAYQYLCKVRC